MNKQQLILLVIGSTLVLVLFFGGNTIPPKKPQPTNTNMQAAATKPTIEFKDLLAKAKQRLTDEQSNRITKLENSVTRGDVKAQQLKMYEQLSSFWKDSMHLFEPFAYYNAQAAKLVGSEKNLTFAAQQFLERLLVEGDPAMQNWLASNAKQLFDLALVLNANNDSSKIGLGACYILGNISDNPMQGILPIREIAKKNPDNLYAQFILGLGGKKSGQYEKAIERFLIIVQKTPSNIEAELHLAECYELKGDKVNAIKWYSSVKGQVKNPDAQKELATRITTLSK